MFRNPQEKSKRKTRSVRKHQMKDFWLHEKFDQNRRTIDYDIAIVEVTPEITFSVILNNFAIDIFGLG